MPHSQLALNRRLVLNPTIESQRRFIADVPVDIGTSNCLLAIKFNRLDMALELLEHGRGLLWGRLMRLRHPLDALRNINPDMATKLESSSRELESLSVADRDIMPAPRFSRDPESSETAHGDLLMQYRFQHAQQTQRLYAASQRWQEALDQIRQIDGFTHYLGITPFSELQRAASEGPVIVVNLTIIGADAIIVRDAQPPILVPLPNAKWSDINKLAADMNKNLKVIHGDVEGWTSNLAAGRWSFSWLFGSSTPSDKSRQDATDLRYEQERRDAECGFREVLRSLWTLVVQPIAEILDTLNIRPQSRIWWYPTSVLWKLPLHAAGPYHEGEANFNDLYISSYMSSFTRHLESNAACSRHRVPSPSMHIVGVPGEPGQKTFLPSVAEEISNIQKLWPSSMSTFSSQQHLLLNSNATPGSVLEAMSTSAWFHIACHGLQDPDTPFDSYFQLYNRRISLKDIIKADLPNAEFAFLSACDTAKGDSIHDEVIHLAAAMQSCGFHSVVGTMWPMSDEDGPRIAEDFYGYMVNPPDGQPVSFRNSAAALHFAVKELQKRNVPLSRWVTFVHYGL